MADLEVTLAGAMTLRRGEQRVEDRSFGSGQFRLVTAMLVVDRADPLPLERLADELWGGRPPARWRPAVRGLVSRLRSHLVDLGLDRDVIVATGGSYHVHLDSVVVDVEQAVSVLATARDALAADAAAEAVTAAGTARSVLSRPVLSGLDTPWVETLRVRLAAAHLDSLVVLATARTALGGALQARPALREAVEIDPLREDAWRALMSVEVAMGNPARALAAYEQCRRHLAEELGVDPAAETQRMHRDILRAGIVPGDRGDVGVDDERPRSDRPPYVGLRTFTQDDADRFFGRDAEVQALVRRLVSHGIVAVVGPSGVGKSSLVRAGLLPALARGAIPDADTWNTVVMVPGSRPFKTLATELARIGGDGDEAALANLLRQPDGLRVAATRMLGDQPPSARLLLVVDQFEELFTLRGADRAASFVALLRRATASRDRRVSVVVTLRSDFYSRAATVPGVAELLSTSQFVVPPLAGEQVEEVVAGPARRTGVSLEPGLLGRIVTDVANEPGALPLLQHLLYELWERRVDHVLTRGAYEDLGGVAGALANRAEALYHGLDRDERAIARRVLLRAGQPAEDGADTRRPVSAGELVGPRDDAVQVDAVVERLVGGRLLTSSHDPATDQRTVELAHEALIGAWPRLRAWVDQARGRLLAHRRLTDASATWDRHDRHDDWLLIGLPLDEAHEVLLAEGAGDVDIRLSPIEHDLVAASVAARERAQADEEERVSRERRLERRSLRRTQALVAVVAVVALVGGGLWLSGRGATRTAEAGRLAAASAEVLATDPQLAMLIALEARNHVGVGDAAVHHDIAEVLHQAVAVDRLDRTWTDIGDWLRFSKDRSMFATAPHEPEPDGSWAVHVRSSETGEVVGTVTGHGGNSPVNDGSFSADGELMATGTTDGVAHLWDWRSGREVGRFDAPDEDEPVYVELSPDGRLLAVTGAWVPGQVKVWDTDTGRVVVELAGPDEDDVVRGAPAFVMFEPSGDRMALVDPLREEVQVLSSAAAEPSRRIPHAGLVSASWGPEGRLALVGQDLTVVDADTGAVVTTVARLDGLIGPPTFSPDGSKLALGTFFGVLQPPRIWTVVDDEGPVAVAGPPEVLPAAPMTCAYTWFESDEVLWEASPCGQGMRRWDLGAHAGAEVAWLPGDPTVPQTGVAFDPGGATLMIGAGEGDVEAWSTTTWQSAGRQHLHEPGDWFPPIGVIDLAFDADGARAVTIGFDDVALWDTATWTPLARGAAPGWGMAAVSPDGEHVAFSSVGRSTGIAQSTGKPVDRPTDELVWIMDAAGQEQVALGWGDDLWATDMAFSPDGRHLAVTAIDEQQLGSPEDGVAVWDWRERRLVARLVPANVPHNLDWDATGTRLVVATDVPGGAEIWDLSGLDVTDDDGVAPEDRAALLITLEGHADWVEDAAFSPDGRRVATCAGDGSARLWDADTGRELRVVVPEGLASSCRVVFSPDGRFLAVQDRGNGVRVFALDLAELADLAEERLVRGWQLEECREYLDLDECPT